MNNKKILIGLFVITSTTLLTSCASKKVGCYYGEESTKIISIEQKAEHTTSTYHFLAKEEDCSEAI